MCIYNILHTHTHTYIHIYTRTHTHTHPPQAIKALKEEGIEVVLINPNVATVQTSKSLGKASPDKVGRRKNQCLVYVCNIYIYIYVAEEKDEPMPTNGWMGVCVCVICTLCLASRWGVGGVSALLYRPPASPRSK